MPKLKATLPKGDHNGLGPVAEAMLKNPRQFAVVLAVVDCAKTEIDHDLGAQIPVLRVRRVEGILSEDLPTAQRLMRRALEYRTGLLTLPLDLEEGIQSAFDQATGAIDSDT